MLSVAKLTVGQEAYYEQEVAGGLDDYYAGRGESPGVWAGRGGEELGLAGVVHEGELGTLLRGFDPASGNRLRTPVKHRTITVEQLDPETGKVVEEEKRLAPVAGFDLVFSCPKSVSLLHALTDDEEVRRAVSEAHDAAWRSALAYLEREACVTRRGEGGTIRERAAGFVSAAFRHRTSRAQDPHLHTHVIVANLAKSSDGEWRALDGNCLLRTYRLAAGYLYEAELRFELSHRLGVVWTEPVKGMAEIAGVPVEAMRAFSTRRRTLLEHLQARGGEGFRAARVAALATRERKKEVPLEQLRAEWRARAAEHGLGREDLRALLGRSLERSEPDLHLLIERLLGPEGLTARQTTFSEPELVCAVAEAHGQGGSAVEIAALARSLTSLAGLALLEPGSVPGRPARLTTRDLLTLEREALELARAGRDAGAPTAAARAVTRALTGRHVLSREQGALVREACRSRDRVVCVVGHAGAGKTTALKTLAEAFECVGVPVLGAAPSGRAAEELRASTGIESGTLHRILLEAHAQGELPHGCVLLVDEAGMAETRILAPLLRLVEEAEGKAVLVGDPAQLPAVGAGGLFASLCERLGALELSENRRQRELAEREALARLRAGEPEPYLAFAAARGRLHVGDEPVEARAHLLADWWQAARSDLEGSVMLAYRRADVAQLNEAARALLAQEGRLGPQRLVVGERDFRPGDRLVCKRNCDLLGVRNGTRGTLEAVERERGALAVLTDAGDRRTLPSWYVSAGFVEHGYALTGHAAQGATVARAFILARDEGALREWGYVACSRAASETHLYLAGGVEREAHGRTIEETDPTTRLADALTRPATERLALEAPGARPDPREARRAQLEQAHARAELRLAETRASVAKLGWWARRRRAPELRSELAFRQAGLDHARDSLARFEDESPQKRTIQRERPELSFAMETVERRRENALTRPEREPPGIGLGW